MNDTTNNVRSCTAYDLDSFRVILHSARNGISLDGTSLNIYSLKSLTHKSNHFLAACSCRLDLFVPYEFLSTDSFLFTPYTHKPAQMQMQPKEEDLISKESSVV